MQLQITYIEFDFGDDLYPMTEQETEDFCDDYVGTFQEVELLETPSVKIVNTARILSSLILCIGYIIVFYYDTITGSRLYLIGNSLALPYMIRNKCWDVVALLAFFIVVGLPKSIG